MKCNFRIFGNFSKIKFDDLEKTFGCKLSGDYKEFLSLE